MKHFLESSQLSYDEVKRLLERADYFRHTPVSAPNYPSYPHQTLANLFYEPSTRTRVSFEMAAKGLGMHVVNINLDHSSESKGEMLEDTLQNLAAMGIRFFAIRHPKNGLPKAIAGAMPAGLHIINAGDGTNEHPSQALLDLFTITTHKPNFENLKMVIVGDLLHSRVANSMQHLSMLMNIKDLVLVAPEVWHPKAMVNGRLTTSLDEALKNADVVMCLRIQKERLREDEQLSLETYRQHYAITKERLALAKKDVLLMHPGPINRGIELDSDVADGPQSCILEQVSNGVFMRMAILDALGSACN